MTVRQTHIFFPYVRVNNILIWFQSVTMHYPSYQYRRKSFSTRALGRFVQLRPTHLYAERPDGARAYVLKTCKGRAGPTRASKSPARTVTGPDRALKKIMRARSDFRFRKNFLAGLFW
jgi:hypothetical protein